jgi:hypothetical protein
MNRPILMCALFALTAVALGAQEANQSSPYEGTSAPPPDDTIVTTVTVRSKPMPGQQIYVQSSVPVQDATTGQLALAGRAAARQSSTQDDSSVQEEPVIQPQSGVQPATQGRDDTLPSSVDPSVNFPDPSLDMPVHSLPRTPSPSLAQRMYAADPDGDIVHPEVLRPGELGAGTTIRVRLMHKLSTGYSDLGESFRTKVASDVVQGSQVLIPAGSEIDGRVVEVSKGHMGGYGTMRLRPETVIMTDGTRYKIYAEVTGTPGSNTRIEGESTIRAGSRLKRDTVEYGACVGGGAAAGAFIGGPIGALTGGLVGAGFVTVHLLVSHPQATLGSGTAMQFTLTEPLFLTPSSGISGN